MSTLRTIEFVTLAGVMESPGLPDHGPDDGFEHGGSGAAVPALPRANGDPSADHDALTRDVVESVDTLTSQDKGMIAVLGSAVLVKTLIESQLVDELSLSVRPLVFGSGKRPLTETTRRLPPRLIDFNPTRTGVLLLSYRPA